MIGNKLAQILFFSIISFAQNIAYGIQIMQVSDGTLVERDVIENFSGDGIRIAGGDNCTIQYNYIKNIIELDPNPLDGNHEDGIQAWVGKDGDDAVYNLIIRGNYILNYTDLNSPFKGILQGISLFDGPYKNALIENNIVIVEHFHGISLFGAYDCKIINNTVLPFPGTFPYIAGPPWIGVFSQKDGTPSKGNIIRNILATNMIIEKNESIADHNLIDPVAFKFVNDYKKFDFSPKPDFIYGGHFIIDNGLSDEAPNIDFIGTPRPQGKGFDIGAYEYKPNNK